MPGSDPTLLGQVAFPGATIEQVVDMGQFPESAGRMETASFTWDLYRAEIEWPNAGTLVWDIALTETNDGVYLVALVTLADYHQALYGPVFVPAVQALAPAVTAEKQAVATPATPPDDGPAGINAWTRSIDGMIMVYVPTGEFDMGNPGTQWIWGGRLRDGDWGLQVFTDEQPQHTVHLDAFWIDQTEVTVGMFRKFVQATAHVTAAERDGYGIRYKAGPKEEEWPHVPGADWQHPRGPGSKAKNDHPVVQVTWDDATAYCELAGGHLPNEAQWEKAARGPDGRMWPWGNTYEGMRGSFCEAQCPVERHRDDYYDDGYAFSAPVGSFPGGASPYGALDMAGNVWEWVADWYDDSYYGDSPYENPTGPPTGTERAQRGGAWYDNESWVRCDDLGFRCVVPAGP